MYLTNRMPEFLSGRHRGGRGPGLAAVAARCRIAANRRFRRLREAARQFDARSCVRIERIAQHLGVPSADCPDIPQNALTTAIDQIRRGLFRGTASLAPK